jgi:phage terminase large subunit-like protein
MSKADRDTLEEYAALLEEQRRRTTENTLGAYQPYPKQMEFHRLGATKRERALIAANQSGKTYSAAMEVAMHLTGLYPADWTGKRFKKPVRVWAAGVSSESVRDGPQRLLLGPMRDGTGSIPKVAIKDIRMSRGIPDAVNTVLVTHITGGTSQLIFKSYEQERAKWQGDTVDLVWYDEEPPVEIYSEGLARITATKGQVIATFTPLLGMSDVVRRFLSEESEDRAVVQMSLEDAGHITPEERARITAGYPAHEREARTKGVPMLGSGRVFQIAESIITEDALSHMPAHWVRVCGLDIGIDHPTAAAWIAWDREADVIHLYDCYKGSGVGALQHAHAIKVRGAGVPVAWPKDAAARDKGSGMAISAQYKALGLNVLSQHAQFPDGSVSVEAGILELIERMETGRFKVARHLEPWFEEYRQYHRKDGFLVKKFDDLLSATRYAVMMKRYAKPGDKLGRRFRNRQTVAQGVDYDLFS